MSTVGTNLWTLADWAKLLDPNGKAAKIVDLMSQANPVLKDAKFIEGNLPTGHRSTVLTGLPSITWRKLNRGVQPSKFTTVQVEDACGLAEVHSKADEEIVELNGGSANARLMEEKPYINAMNKEVNSGFYYFDTDVDPEKFLGLAARYPYNDAPNVINNGGSGSDVTSIWLVCWGEDTVHMIFPKGSKAGINHRDVGNGKSIMVNDDQTPAGQYLAFVSQYKWKIGLVVKDWRYVVRIANIETAGSSNTFDHKKLIEAVNLIPDMQLPGLRPVIYCNRTIKTQLEIAAADSSNRMFGMMKDAFGDEVPSFRGIPIRKDDNILDTETALTATP